MTDRRERFERQLSWKVSCREIIYGWYGLANVLRFILQSVESIKLKASACNARSFRRTLHLSIKLHLHVHTFPNSHGTSSSKDFPWPDLWMSLLELIKNRFHSGSRYVTICSSFIPCALLSWDVRECRHHCGSDLCLISCNPFENRCRNVSDRFSGFTFFLNSVTSDACKNTGRITPQNSFKGSTQRRACSRQSGHGDDGGSSSTGGQSLPRLLVFVAGGGDEAKPAAWNGLRHGWAELGAGGAILQQVFLLEGECSTAPIELHVILLQFKKRRTIWVRRQAILWSQRVFLRTMPLFWIDIYLHY